MRFLGQGFIVSMFDRPEGFRHIKDKVIIDRDQCAIGGEWAMRKEAAAVGEVGS